MKKIVISIVLGLFSIVCGQLTAQVLDGAFSREHTPKREFVPYQSIREADAMYSKKVLRTLELKEKINHPLYFPLSPNIIGYPGGNQPQRARMSLLRLVYEIGILGNYLDNVTGNLVDAEDDFSRRYPVYEANLENITTWWRTPIPIDEDITRRELLSYSIEDQGEFVNIPLLPADYYQMDRVWMWEEWVFDRQRSVMDVRILALAFEGYVGGNRIFPFWISYNDYRPLFAKYEVFNTQNDAERRTFDDIFFKRRFSSYIVAETNPYDNRLISDYLLGIDAIREGERIQDVLFKFEHDQWEY